MSDREDTKWGGDGSEPVAGSAEDTDAAAAAGETLPYYGSVEEFVSEYLRQVYRRRIDSRQRVWAAEWWNAPEAVVRLEALWRSWEELRLNPGTGIAVWLRDYADHHMAVLFSPDGPFTGSDTTTKAGEALPHTPAPVGLFPVVPSVSGRSGSA